MWLHARGLSVYKQRPSILRSCLDAASEDRVLGMSLVLTDSRGRGKKGKNAKF